MTGLAFNGTLDYLDRTSPIRVITEEEWIAQQAADGEVPMTRHQEAAVWMVIRLFGPSAMTVGICIFLAGLGWHRIENRTEKRGLR